MANLLSTTPHLYPVPQDVGDSARCRYQAKVLSPSRRRRVMQDPAFGVPRISLLGTRVNRTLCRRVCVPLGAFAADHDDARAGRGQRLTVPVAVAPHDGKAVVVQQRRKFLREGVTQRYACDLGALLGALEPAPV